MKSEHDLLVWFEICELEASGEYIPVMVDHSDDLPCSGKFLLHQGVQRRIAVTLCHETGSDLIWKDVKEVVIGRVRGHRDHDNYQDQNVLSLNVVSSYYVHKPDDERTFYRFEISWDSSMHNSTLLNRVTPSKDWIYITITCYLEIENFVQPACITKDLSLIFYARDARVTLPRSLRSLIYGGIYRSTDANKVSGVYRLTVKQAAESGASPGARRRSGRVVDSTSNYVRGEEMLQGWRPRSDSIIFEHQWDLEKLTRLKQVEKTKHYLLLKNTILVEPNSTSTVTNGESCSSSDSDIKTDDEEDEFDENDEDLAKEKRVFLFFIFKIKLELKFLKHSKLIHSNKPSNNSRVNRKLEEKENSIDSYTDNQKQLLLNCIKLINHGRLISSTQNGTNQSPNMSRSRSVMEIPNINVNKSIKIFYFYFRLI